MEELKRKIKELAEKVYKELGPFGFIEETKYEVALAYEFRKNRLKYLEQLQVNIMYEDQIVKEGKVDFIVFDEKEENGLIVELKAKEEIEGGFLHQLLKYYEAIKSEKSGFPKFLSEKIKGGVVLNWRLNKPIRNKLLEGFKEPERISFVLEPEIEKFSIEYKDIIDLIEIEVPVEKKRK
ncbi:MAG: GxxExxY protein [candidate division WOR-3 bacterium]